MPTFIKFCGVTRPEDALACAEAGCDAVGVVFWPESKRCVTTAQARAIREVLFPNVTLVGVFVDADPTFIMRHRDETGITAAQLCGRLPDGDWIGLGRSLKLIRAIGIKNEQSGALLGIEGVDDYLADNGDGGSHGGSGRPFVWTLASPLKSLGRLWLAGGLTCENVGAAIRAVRPYAVDVSSGIESSPGIKSAERISAFIAAVQEADRGAS